jgi:DNA helicase-2/ATP-dependent DNA helicase PcrA
LYLKAADDLRRNTGQWTAYESEGNCVVLAGPGSGKTKTLTIKLARMLFEDVEEPRGIACITYNNECARELERRLNALGIANEKRLFVGTIHSFCLTQVLLPYARTARLGLPDDFKVANSREEKVALERAFRRFVGGPENPETWRYRMNTHRRSYPSRNSDAWLGEAQLVRLIEGYENELRRQGLIDFEDMPLLGFRALRDNEWLRTAMFAKFPILAVDEYQDLGRALHGIVLRLCFSAGARLFAVGDVDQSIYGFAGAYPELLQGLAEREDVNVVRLRLNYRSGSDIVTASGYALGEDRGYTTPDDAGQGVVYFHPSAGQFAQHANFVFRELVPQIKARFPELPNGEIAVLYPAAYIGDHLHEAANAHGYQTVRSDTNALYPRGSRLLRWLEQCSGWCSGGWQSGQPSFSLLVAGGCRLMREGIRTADARVIFQQRLMEFLWARRGSEINLHHWLKDVRGDLLAQITLRCRGLRDDLGQLEILLAKTEAGEDLEAMTLAEFSGTGAALDRIALSTLHSAKGREFNAVILFAMDEGRVPRPNPSAKEIVEQRRLFYVGFTRPKAELHIVYSAARPSRFVTEVKERLEEE